MDPTLIVIGVVSACVVALGVIGALIRRSDVEVRKHTLREKAQRERELTKAARGAFAKPLWWEVGKAREQADYFAAIRTATGDASPTAVHALHAVYEGERKRKQRRRTWAQVATVLAVGVGAALLVEPALTAKVFSLFTVPIVTFASGVGLFRFGQSPAITMRDGGVWIYVAEVIIILTGIGAGILGLVLGVRAYLAW